MNEEIDQHFPSGIAKQFGGSNQLLAEQSSPHRSLCVGVRNIPLIDARGTSRTSQC